MIPAHDPEHPSVYRDKVSIPWRAAAIAVLGLFAIKSVERWTPADPPTPPSYVEAIAARHTDRATKAQVLAERRLVARERRGETGNGGSTSSTVFYGGNCGGGGGGAGGSGSVWVTVSGAGGGGGSSTASCSNGYIVGEGCRGDK